MPTSRTGDAGFGLIEVLVALTLLGLALSAALTAARLVLDHLRPLVHTERLALRSQELLARLAIDDPALTTRGRTAEGLSWTIEREADPERRLDHLRLTLETASGRSLRLETRSVELWR